MKNHIVIGLGGTGCAVVREFKKLLFAEWRTRGGEGTPPIIMDFNDRFGGQLEEVRIATLSVDSNAGDLNGHKDEWVVMGEQLTLQDAEKLLLVPHGLGNVLSNMSNYPGIKPWIENDRDQVAEITKGTDQPNGCNQIRRLGRLMLANGDNLNNFRQKFTEQRNRLIKGGNVDLTVHICCTLGCGTGSGTLVDVIAQIRKLLSTESGNSNIFVHGFATSSNVPANTGNFYANQYAVLQELNALRVGKYKPWDISAKNQPERFSVADAFGSTFITTNTTESRQNLTLTEQVEMNAEFLFQKLVRLMGTMPARLQKAHTFEDVDQYPTDEDGSDRSTRFASFGVKRLVIPDKEIHEKLAYSFSEQFLLKALYDNWAGGENGFIDSPLDFNDDAFVHKRRSIWGLEHGQLSLDLSDKEVADDDHRPFKTEWDQEAGVYREETIDDLGEDSWEEWLQEYDDMIGQLWARGFRSKGVDNYFNIRGDSKEISKRARKLVTNVEKDLLRGFEELRQEYQVHHYASVVRRIKQALEHDRKLFAEEGEEAQRNRQRAEELCDDNADQFASVGVISRKLGKHRDIYQAYTKARRDAHLHMTEARACDYAIQLIDAMMPELNRLLGSVERFSGALRRMQDKHRAWVANRIRENQDEEEDHDDENVVIYVDPVEVNGSIQRLETDADAQELNAAECVAAVKGLRGPSDGFDAYLNVMGSDDEDSVGEFGKRLHNVAFAQSRIAHDKLSEDSSSKFSAILGQNIVEKLSVDNGGSMSGELQARLRKFIELAMPAATFDGNATDLGHFGATSPIFGRWVFLPESEKQQSFREELKGQLQLLEGGSGGKSVSIEILDIPEKRNATEIVFLSIGYFFPLRMLDVTKRLRERFQDRIDSDPARANFQVFSEKHVPALPDLLRPDDSVRRSDALKYLAIGAATGLLDCPSTPTDKPAKLRLARKKDGGRPIDPLDISLECTPDDRALAAQPVESGKLAVDDQTVALIRNFNESFDAGQLSAIEGKVMGDLTPILKDNGAEGILAKLEGLCDQSYQVLDGDEDDPRYKAIIEACSQAKQLVESMA